MKSQKAIERIEYCEICQKEVDKNWEKNDKEYLTLTGTFEPCHRKCFIENVNCKCKDCKTYYYIDEGECQECGGKLIKAKLSEVRKIFSR